ncbi:MAG: hypothetical protein WDM88_10510 [Galbitalea sp.]
MPVLLAVVLALICCAALACLVALQVALLFGAPLGRFAWGGEDHYLQPPQRPLAVGAVVGYLVAALVVLQGADLFLLVPVLAAQVATYVFCALFFAAFVLTARSRNPIERHVMLPTNLVLSALFLIVAVTGHS